jgi:hypothetical protein
MSISKVTAGQKVPYEFNVIIEIPMNADPIKYEVDKESGALFVDRFMMTAMHYPANYGYVPQTIAADNDPVDVLVHTPFPAAARAWWCAAAPSACCAWTMRPAAMPRCSPCPPTISARFLRALEIDRGRAGYPSFADSSISSSTTRTSSPASGYGSSAGRASSAAHEEILSGAARYAKTSRPAAPDDGRDRPRHSTTLVALCKPPPVGHC